MKRTLCLIPAALLLLGGCAYFVAQSPEVQAPGKLAIGGLAGVSPAWLTTAQKPTIGNAEIGLFARTGLAKGADAGLRADPLHGLLIDARYQLLRRRFLLTAGIGLSYAPRLGVAADLANQFGVTWLDGVRILPTTIGLHPMVIMGTKQAYGGAKAVIQSVTFADSASAQNYIVPVIFAGARVGKRVEFLPEANIFWMAAGPQAQRMVGLSLGIAVQYQLGGKYKLPGNIKLPTGL